MIDYKTMQRSVVFLFDLAKTSDKALLDGVLSEFYSFCAVPHGSGAEKPLSDLLLRRFHAAGLTAAQDVHGNLTVEFPASAGCEHAPLIAVQGHLDMVCAARADSGWDGQTDPVRTQIRDGWLCSDGASSLGADCGIGNAAALWLLTGARAAHGPVRLLLTVEEETGLRGALAMDAACVRGVRYFINLDGFSARQAVIASAGGLRETFRRPLQICPAQGQTAVRIALSGLRGGHSGYDICKNRANAVRQLCAHLLALRVPYELADLQGGTASNAIPFACVATLVVAQEHVARLRTGARHLQTALLTRYGEHEPDISVTLTQVDRPETVWTQACARAVLELCTSLRDGVYAMRSDMRSCVRASSNLGAIVTAGNAIEVHAMVRCADAREERVLAALHDLTAAEQGFTRHVSRYPSWPAAASPALAHRMDGLCRRMSGAPLELAAVHVGLEPSAFYAKNPQMELVSIGATILHPHSPEERVELSSIVSLTRLLAATLADLAAAHEA